MDTCAMPPTHLKHAPESRTAHDHRNNERCGMTSRSPWINFPQLNVRVAIYNQSPGFLRFCHLGHNRIRPFSHMIILTHFERMNFCTMFACAIIGHMFRLEQRFFSRARAIAVSPSLGEGTGRGQRKANPLDRPVYPTIRKCSAF